MLRPAIGLPYRSTSFARIQFVRGASGPGLFTSAATIVVGALVITWLNPAEVLAECETSPEYVAVTVCPPACRPATARVACPPSPTGALPRTALPSLKVTDPV